MKYELAEKLKDAGFPQTPAIDFWSQYWYKKPDGSFHIDGMAWLPDSYVGYKIPTLGELIDECEKLSEPYQGFQLKKYWIEADGSGFVWFASVQNSLDGEFPETVSGLSAIEAVANLYLVLVQSVSKA